jgi:hypothetical protein
MGVNMKKVFLMALFGLSFFSELEAIYGDMPQCFVCTKELRRSTKIIPDCGHTQCIHCFALHKYSEHNESCQCCGKSVQTNVFKNVANGFINIFDAGENQATALDLCDTIVSLDHSKFTRIVDELEVLRYYSADKDLVIREDVVNLLGYYLNFRHKRFSDKTPLELAREAGGRDGFFSRTRYPYYLSRLKPIADCVKKQKKK